MNASNEDTFSMSSEELLERRDNWTLACDNVLLNKLKSFSKDLEERSVQILEDCDKLSRDSSLLQAKVHNVTNSFLALSNTQFVENRVQEFEEKTTPQASSASASSSNSKMTKSEKEAALIAKMKESIQLGISCNIQHRHQTTEETGPQLALPYLIGSSKYYGSRYVGLVEDERRIAKPPPPTAAVIKSDVAVMEDSDTYSLGPNSETSIPYSSEPTSIFQETHPYPIYSPSDTQAQVRPPVINPPLAKNDVHGKPAHPSAIPAFMQNPAPRKEYFGAISSELPPPMPPVDDSDEDSEDDDFQPIGNKSGRLFADEDDDDDIFNDSSIFPSNKPKNLFFDQSISSSAQPVAVAHPRLSPPPTKYDSNDESEVGKKPVSTKDMGNPRESIHSSYSTDSVLEVPSSTSSSVPVKAQEPIDSATKPFKIPPGGVSIFGNLPPSVIPKIHAQNIENNTAVANAKPETSVPGSVQKCVNVPSAQSIEKSSQPSRKSVPESQSSNASVINPTRPAKSKSKEIFTDDSESEDDLFSGKKQSIVPDKPKEKSVPVSTASSKPTEKGLKPGSGTTTGSAQTRQTVADSSSTIRKDEVKKSNSAGPVRPVPVQKKGIFDDDSDDDLFASFNKPKVVGKPTTSTSSPLFSQKPKTTKAPELVISAATTSNRGHIPESSKVLVDANHSSGTSEGIGSSQGSLNEAVITRSKVKSIFDDDSEDELFPSKKSSAIREVTPASTLPPVAARSNSSVPSPTAKARSKRPIFEDSDSDDGLFSSASSVTSKMSNNTEVTGTLSAKDMGQTLEKPKASLFDDSDDSESDLFSSKKLTKPKIKDEEKEIFPVDNKDNNTNIEPPESIEKIAQPMQKDEDLLTISVAEPSSKTVVALESHPEASANTKEDDIGSRLAKIGKPKVNVKKLASGLQINPLAMMPGAKLRKKEEEKLSVPKLDEIGKEKPEKNDESMAIEGIKTSLSQEDNKLESHEESEAGRPAASIESRQPTKEKTPPIATEELDGVTQNQKENTDAVDGLTKVVTTKVNVKKLALGLKINPLAMMPGAKLKKQSSKGSNESESPVGEEPTSPESLSKTEQTPPPLSDAPDANIPKNDGHVKKSASQDIDDEDGDNPVSTLAISTPVEEEPPDIASPPHHPKLVNLGKGRAKHQTKRRPPSKKLLHTRTALNPDSKTEAVDCVDNNEVSQAETLNDTTVESTKTSNESSEVLDQTNALKDDPIPGTETLNPTSEISKEVKPSESSESVNAAKEDKFIDPLTALLDNSAD